MEPRQFPAIELERLFRSKKDLYRAMKYGLQLHLPSPEHAPLTFLRDVAHGRKKLLPMSELRLLNFPPGWKELSAVDLLEA